MTRRGFTLVEGLVVVAILLTLVGLLWPAFSAARAAAKRHKDGVAEQAPPHRLRKRTLRPSETVRYLTDLTPTRGSGRRRVHRSRRLHRRRVVCRTRVAFGIRKTR